MARKAKVISDPSLERDLTSNAVISKNPAGYLARMAHKKVYCRHNQEVAELKDQVKNLTSLVEQLLKKNS
jgi:hypothetical protein